jgi:transmembrane sensor
VVIGIGIWGFRLRSNPATTAAAATATPSLFTTGVGDRAAFQLADGTVVRLAPASTLRVLDPPASRQVWLEGRAFFAVAKRDGMPFRVLTHGGETTVLGTQFEIRTQGSDVDVVVLEGRVALSNGRESAEILPGQRRAITEGVVSAAQPVADVKSELAWVGRFLVFEATPLTEVAAEVTRVFRVRMQLLPDAPRDLLITGWFSDQTAAETVSAICLAAGVTCAWQDSTVTVGR